MSRNALLVSALVLGACSSSGSDTPRPGGVGENDAGPPDAGPNDGSEAGPNDRVDAGSSAGDSCGPIDGAYRRCVLDPIAQAGFQHPDGRYELSIGDPDVHYDATTKRWRAWWSTTLAPGYAGPYQTGIKVAESADGVHWEVQDDLTIAASPGSTGWDAVNLETPSVIEVKTNPPERRFLLFYSGASITRDIVDGASRNTVPWYQIGLAFSADGKHFTKLPAAESPYAGKTTPFSGAIDGLVLLGVDAFPGLAGVTDGIVADPEVVWDGSTFHLFFSSMPAKAVAGGVSALGYGISHATSKDGIHWTAAAGNPIAALTGSQGPSVVRTDDGTWEVHYKRDTAAELSTVPSIFNPMLGIYRATSKDLVTWTPDAARELAWDGANPAEKYGWIAVGDMALVSGEHWYFYPAFGTTQPPEPDWVVPLQGGKTTPSLIVLNVARRR